MPIRPNAESRLISALVNIQDVEAARRFGIHPEMLVSYQAEYRWLISFPPTYAHQPSVESLKTKFTDFPYSEAYTDVAFICSEVKQQHNKRQLVRMTRDLSHALYDDDVDEAYAVLSSMAVPGNTLSYELTNTLHDLSFLDNYEDDEMTIGTPWKSLQDATGGLYDGDLIYLAARPGQGKSWSLASFIDVALMEGKKVMMFSLEMPKKQVMPRIHTLLAKSLGIKDVRHLDLKGKTFDPIAYRKLGQRIKEEVPGELFVVDTSKGSISPSHVHDMSKDMDFVLIDYVGLMASPLGGRAVDDWRTMAAISNILKETAVQRNIPILAAAQINREGDTTGNRPPKLKNLAQSDALGQDADVAITMKQLSKTVAVYSLEKNRSGEGGALWNTMYLPNEGRFDEIGFDRARDMRERDADREMDD
jgi:replicative DNA helicase